MLAEKQTREDSIDQLAKSHLPTELTLADRILFYVISFQLNYLLLSSCKHPID